MSVYIISYIADCITSMLQTHNKSVVTVVQMLTTGCYLSIYKCTLYRTPISISFTYITVWL